MDKHNNKDSTLVPDNLLWQVFKIKEFGIFICFCFLFVFFSFMSPVFFGETNLLNVIRQVSLLGIQALGMTLVIAVGGIDISVGAIYALCATCTAVLMTQKGVPILLACIVGLLIGSLFGAINGFVIGYLHIPAFIATMGTMNVARGLALLLSNGMIISLDSDPVPDPQNLPAFFSMGGGSVVGIPSLAIIFIVLAIIAYFFFHKSIIGFRMRAVGGSQEAAKASGINVNMVNMATYVILGVLCGLTGLLNFSFMHTVQGTMGSGMELEVIAAVIIGGANPIGGGGTIFGTVIGVLIMGILKNGLVLMGVNAQAQIVIIGLLIIVVVTLDIRGGFKRKN
jgi:ribose/xylose/arabinose/galactoside ABC-type transport system permease subunit